MSSFFLRQPNGKLARFSTFIDDFTEFDMTPEEAESVVLEERIEEAKREAKEAVQRALDDVPPRMHGVKGTGLQRWQTALETVEAIHGKKKRKKREQLEFDPGDES